MMLILSFWNRGEKLKDTLKLYKVVCDLVEVKRIQNKDDIQYLNDPRKIHSLIGVIIEYLMAIMMGQTGIEFDGLKLPALGSTDQMRQLSTVPDQVAAEDAKGIILLIPFLDFSELPIYLCLRWCHSSGF